MRIDVILRYEAFITYEEVHLVADYRGACSLVEGRAIVRRLAPSQRMMFPTHHKRRWDISLGSTSKGSEI